MAHRLYIRFKTMKFLEETGENCHNPNLSKEFFEHKMYNA